MGFNTSFMLLNDHVHQLQGDPHVGDRLCEMTRDLSTPKEGRRHRYGYRGIQAIHCAHADHEQIIRVGRNFGELIGFGSVLNPLLEAAIALSKTKEPAERRRLIRTIETMAAVHLKCPARSDFTM